MSQLTEAQSFLNTIVDNVPASIVVRALPDAQFVLVNREAERLIGMPRDTLLGKSVDKVFPDARRAEFRSTTKFRSPHRTGAVR